LSTWTNGRPQTTQVLLKKLVTFVDSKNNPKNL